MEQPPLPHQPPADHQHAHPHAQFQHPSAMAPDASMRPGPPTLLGSGGPDLLAAARPRLPTPVIIALVAAVSAPLGFVAGTFVGGRDDENTLVADDDRRDEDEAPAKDEAAPAKRPPPKKASPLSSVRVEGVRWLFPKAKRATLRYTTNGKPALTQIVETLGEEPEWRVRVSSIEPGERQPGSVWTYAIEEDNIVVVERETAGGGAERGLHEVYAPATLGVGDELPLGPYVIAETDVTVTTPYGKLEHCIVGEIRAQRGDDGDPPRVWWCKDIGMVRDKSSATDMQLARLESGAAPAGKGDAGMAAKDGKELKDAKGKGKKAGAPKKDKDKKDKKAKDKAKKPKASAKAKPAAD